MSLQRPKHTNLLYHLGLLTRRWRQVLDAEFQTTGLTDASWRPLLHLSHLGDNIRQKDLAASVGIEGPSLGRLLDTLIKKGLIERSADTRDRRAKLLSLTPAGHLLIEKIRNRVSSLEQELLSPFGEQEVGRLVDFILQLEASVQELREKNRRLTDSERAPCPT